MPDADLLVALKQAKLKKMFFAFFHKGTDGKLIISKKKILPKEIAEAKKEIGGGPPVTGKCFAEGSTMVFQVAKPTTSALAAVVRKIAKRETGLTIDPEFRLAADADAEELEDTGVAAAGATAPAAAPAAPAAAAPAAPGQANVLGIQKALQKLGFDPGRLDGVMGPPTQAAVKKFQQANGLPADGVVDPKTQAALAKALQGAPAAAGGAPAPPAPAPPAPAPSAAASARPSEPGADATAKPPTEQELAALEDRRRDFKKARAAWVAVKTKAEEDVEKVKDGARMAYLADAEQFPKIVKGCKDIDAILDNLDDELRDTLDQYASTPLKNQTKLHSLAATATEILDRYCGYVESNPVMKAIDNKEFADVTIHAPIMKALADLRKALS
jgi:peptidoglycan hydrolase-like protein with peptidoglycan-binding domain